MLFVAAFAIASAACAREEIFDNEQSGKEVRTFTCSFDEDAQTRTDITKQGKTVWSVGDKIFVSNGTESDTLTVDSKFAGQRYFEFSTTLEGKIYVVYPCTAAKGVENGKFLIDVPNVQEGSFGSANIACAVAEDRYVKLKNVTTVLKFRIPDDVAAPVMVVSVNGMGENMSGIASVDLSTGTPVVEALSDQTYTSDVRVMVESGVGNFYASVIPGTYQAGFSLSAVTLDLNHASEIKTTAADKELKANELYDLGKIGSDLKPIAGDGSEGNPYQIGSLSDYLVMAYYVSEGHNMRDQHIKLTNDINGVTMPMGIYDATVVPNIERPFQGEFDGNGKTLTLSIKQTNGRATGLFASVRDSAYIHNVKLAGSVYSSGNYTGALAGILNAAEKGVTIKECSSSAMVEGSQYVGGLVGFSNSSAAGTLTFDNCQNSGTVIANGKYAGGISGQTGYDNKNIIIKSCSNSGSVTGTASTGGISGYSLNVSFNNCVNSGNVTATQTNGDVYYIYVQNGKIYGNFRTAYNNGTGGISGWTQASSITNCRNSGTLSAQNKVGGISGSNYWTGTSYCENTGRIVATHWGVAGGIVGWGVTNANIRDCVNNGEVVGEVVEGTSGRWVGGIAGYIQVQMNKGAYSIERCTNNGPVSGDGQGVGGIVGYTHSYNNAPCRIEIRNCTNNGSVTNKQSATAGIVGYQYDFGSWTGIPIDNCKNTGDITSLNDAGGIIGYFQGRVTGSRTNLRNCENSGTILSTKKANDTGAYAGGIVGRTNGLTTCGAYIWNCLNTGKIQFSDASFKNAYVGGIAGSLYGEIWNSYNGGEVGLAGAETPEAALATVGALAGSLLNNKVHYSYYLEGSSVYSLGTSSKVKATESVLSATKEGVLSSSIKIGDKLYDGVVDALNAGKAGQTFYYDWTTGPKFSLTGKVGIGDGLDLGNGGKL